MIPEPRTAATLCVSIVVYESDIERLRATLVCALAALERARRDGELERATVVVLDNASPPSYRRALAQLLDALKPADESAAYPAIESRYNSANRGFGAGHNRALADTDCDYLLILNPDVELLQDAISVALRHLREHPRVAAANPRSQRDDGSREHLCKRYPAVLDLLLRGFAPRWLRQRFSARLARYEYRDLPDDRPAPVQLVSGACLLTRRCAFRDCGGFDADFFLYFEDFDLAMRLARQGELAHLPAMRVVHHGGDAARKGLRHIGWFLRSAARFYARHGWRWL